MKRHTKKKKRERKKRIKNRIESEMPKVRKSGRRKMMNAF